MDMVIIEYGKSFIGNPQDLALVRMEFHLVSFFPSLEGVQVFLEDFSIFETVDKTIDETIVCEKADDSSWRKTFTYVIYVNQEQ